MSRVAVIGAGMTRFVRRAEETPGELTAQAVEMALQDAGLELKDIDAVCLGTAPDAFDGIHMNGENLIAGAGASGKPYLRHFVGGGTGVMSPIHGWMHVASGKFNTCLVVAEEKMSPCVPHPAGAFLTIFDHTTEQPLELTLIHIFAIEMARFMHVYGYKEEELALVSVQTQAERARPPGRPDRPEDHGGGRDELAAPLVAGQASGHQPHLGRRGGPGAHQRAHRALALQGAGLHRRRGLPPGHRLLVHPRPGLPRLRGHGRPGRLPDGGHCQTRGPDRRVGALRSLRVQGAPPHERAPDGPDRKEGARDAALRRVRPRRQPSHVPVGRRARCGQPHRGHRPHEDRRALLPAHRPGRQAPGQEARPPRHRAGVGRPDAGGHGGDHVR